ncbi:MAG: DNA polymerase III subunit alpha [Candidatus Paceibacterota bacterium]|nr:MAG: DNA polymerase III subunit alpha [Candidatus Paceibacterota bacterium]
MRKFIHLHTHSHYSLLSALPKIKELVASAKAENMRALALTDNGNLYGAIEFYKECKKENIKPIVGVDFYVALRSRNDKQAGIDNKRTRLLLLAKNYEGYLNLIKLVTLSHLEGFYYKPRVDKELLEKYGQNLVCISPALSSEISQALAYSDFEKTEEIISWHKKIFGQENFYLEITHHPEIPGHQEKMLALKKLSEQSQTPMVAGQEVFYLKPEDKMARKTMLSIQTNSENFSGSFNEEEDFSFISEKQAEEYFKDFPNALENTLAIAEKCNLELELGKWVFPNYKTENNLTHDIELKNLVYEGLKERNLKETDEIKNRIEYELEIIKKKGYAPYFLVVADLLKFARKNNIFSTTRGSAAGSMVSYLTFITTVNPIEYKLPFERFLNPERPSAPDIDMDFADSRRDEVIAYAKQKYGENQVAQIGTFGTMMARAAVRDVARALNFPYSVGDRIAKLIPFGAQGFPMTIDKALSQIPELQSIYKEEKDVKEIMDMAKKIEGCARHISVHAAGVVISPTPLTNFVPLQYDPKGEGKVITQYDMHSVEDAGLLKFDFLGIKNLSILADSVKLVEKLENKKVEIENIPLNDKKTFEMLSRGETSGLFQLNGSGMTKYLKDLKPTAIHDINAMVALYRPGPIESIPTYIERKREPHTIAYLDPRMKEILSESYGVITYQDDVMMIAIKLAGYSWLEADKLRKAMGKKIPEEMEAQKEKLIEGLKKNGMTEKRAEVLWKLIEPFAAYGFNKAHAASYGRVAYQTAYMKANFPVIYMSAVLTADSGDTEKVAEAVSECKRMGISVLPPSINESFSVFTVIKEKADEKDKIRFGLMTIKNFGAGISEAIIQERDRGGKFKDLADFLERIKDKNLNKKSLEALIKCGALDDFGERGQMLQNLDNLLAFHKEKIADQNSNQSSLFGLAKNSSFSALRLEQKDPASEFEKLGWEKELLGLYVSGHPLENFTPEVKEKYFSKIKILKENQLNGLTVIAGGIIEEVKQIATKSGDLMVFIKLSDLTGSIEAVVFPKVFQNYKDIIRPENCIALKGRLSDRNGEKSIVVEKIKTINREGEKEGVEN